MRLWGEQHTTHSNWEGLGAGDQRLAVDRAPYSVASPLSEHLLQPEVEVEFEVRTLSLIDSSSIVTAVAPLAPFVTLQPSLRPISARTRRMGGSLQGTPPECSHMSFPNTSPAFGSHIGTLSLSSVFFLVPSARRFISLVDSRNFSEDSLKPFLFVSPILAGFK